MFTDTLRTVGNLNRIGLATQEKRTRKSPLQILNENSAELEAILRSLPQIQQWAADVLKGLPARANGCELVTFDTNSVPATGNGFRLELPKMTGGFPLQSLTVDSVGGAGTTMQASINGSKFFRVDAGDVFDTLDIWHATFRVTSGGAGTANLFCT